MKNLKLFCLLSGLLFSALVMNGCGDDDEDPLGGAKTPSEIQWAQHTYQIHCSGESFGEAKWEGLYASIYEKWTFKGSNKDHRIFFSHYRWFPADYGPTFWTSKLDNGDWYYEGRYDSHEYTTKIVDNNRTEITFDMQGRTWHGIITDGDIVLSTPNGEASMTLKLLPAKAYDGSYDEILKEIL